MATDQPATRVEAESEGPAVVISIYAPLFFSTLELTAVESRRLAAELIHAADETEAMGHVEN